MINRVILAGKLLRPPVALSGPRRGCELVLQLEHVPHWGGSPAERCGVRVVLFGQQRAEVAQKWLDAGRAIVLHGHLINDGRELLVEAERWEFLSDGLVSRCLWEGTRAPGADPGPGAGQGGGAYARGAAEPGGHRSSAPPHLERVGSGVNAPEYMPAPAPPPASVVNPPAATLPAATLPAVTPPTVAATPVSPAPALGVGHQLSPVAGERPELAAASPHEVLDEDAHEEPLADGEDEAPGAADGGRGRGRGRGRAGGGKPRQRKLTEAPF